MTLLKQANIQSGFTLAELLIALGILGVIAMFTIPKILQSQQDAKLKSLFKETYATLYNVSQQAVTLGANPTTNRRDFLLPRLNYVKYCPNKATTEGCWNTTVQGTFTGFGMGQAGFVLANGVVITGYMHEFQYQGQYVIDLNGLEGPNQEGQDQIAINNCPPNFSSLGIAWSCPNMEWGYPTFSGALGPISGRPASSTRYQQFMEG